MHGVVDQEIRHISGNQAAGHSTRYLEVEKARASGKEQRKTDDAYPDRRSNSIMWTRMVHPMEVLEKSYFMVDEAID